MSEFFATNAPDPPHWTLNFCLLPLCLDAFGTVPLLYDTRLKTGRTVVINAKVQATKLRRIFCNKSTLSTPCFGAFHSVWVHLGPFRYCMKLGAKWVEVVQLIQKFMPRSRVRCFHNERTQSTPLDLKLIYCRVS